MNPQDPSSRRRPPGPGEPSPEESRTGSRDRGLRHVRRLSNATAVALVAATAVTAGYFAHGSAVHPRPAAVTGSQSQVPNSHRPCLTKPVAVSGGSGVTTTTAPASSCAPGTSGTAPTVVYVHTGEHSGDGRGD
jgi:hypothetical protein